MEECREATAVFIVQNVVDWWKRSINVQELNLICWYHFSEFYSKVTTKRYPMDTDRMPNIVPILNILVNLIAVSLYVFRGGSSLTLHTPYVVEHNHIDSLLLIKGKVVMLMQWVFIETSIRVEYHNSRLLYLFLCTVNQRQLSIHWYSTLVRLLMLQWL